MKVEAESKRLCEYSAIKSVRLSTYWNSKGSSVVDKKYTNLGHSVMFLSKTLYPLLSTSSSHEMSRLD